METLIKLNDVIANPPGGLAMTFESN